MAFDVGTAGGSIKDFMQQISSGGFLTNPIFTKLGAFAKILLYIGVVVIGIAAFWKYVLKYDKVVLIKVFAGSRMTGELYRDRGYLTTDIRGKRKIVMQKSKNTCPLGKTYFKEGKKEIYEIGLDKQTGIFFPLDSSLDNEGRIKVMPALDEQQWRGWHSQEQQLLRERTTKEGFFEKHKEFILILVVTTISFLIMFFVSKEMGAGLKANAAAFQEVAKACLGQS